MARSQLCMSCGRDLGSIGIRRDPHYGLPIVTCPGCRVVVIRRRHPLEQGWRTARRVGPVVIVLVLQAFVLASLAAGVTGACTVTADAAFMEDQLSTAPLRTSAVRVALIFGVTPLVLGTWLTAGLAHWRRWAAWLAFFGLVTTLLSLDVIGLPLFARGLETAGVPLTVPPARWSLWVTRLTMLAPIALLSLTGIPLGLALIAIDRSVRRSRCRARRRRRRPQGVSA